MFYFVQISLNKVPNFSPHCLAQESHCGNSSWNVTRIEKGTFRTFFKAATKVFKMITKYWEVGSKESDLCLQNVLTNKVQRGDLTCDVIRNSLRLCFGKIWILVADWSMLAPALVTWHVSYKITTLMAKSFWYLDSQKTHLWRSKRYQTIAKVARLGMFDPLETLFLLVSSAHHTFLTQLHF